VTGRGGLRCLRALVLLVVLLGLAPVARAAPSDPASGIAPPAAALTTPDGVRRALTPTTVAPGSAAAVDPGQLLAAAVGDDAPVPTSTAVRLILFLTGLSFIPALVVVMTPFVRFVVVFSMLRQALGLQQAPPNQVLIGLSLFLTLVVMEPTFTLAWNNGLAPFLDGAMQPGDALDATLAPVREFMLANTRRADMATVLDVARIATPETLADIPTSAVASAYVLSELKTAFIIAVYIFIPFLVIDLVVSSILLGMGMMMMPPVLVSLPLKLMVFVLMDGWALLVRNLVAGIAR
jgi:flagellar biosynthetic protein FliP